MAQDPKDKRAAERKGGDKQLYAVICCSNNGLVAMNVLYAESELAVAHDILRNPHRYKRMVFDTEVMNAFVAGDVPADDPELPTARELLKTIKDELSYVDMNRGTSQVLIKRLETPIHEALPA